MHTDNRDYELLDDIAGYFELLASDCDALAARGYSRRSNEERAKVWREAASDVRSITLTAVGPRPPTGDT